MSHKELELKYERESHKRTLDRYTALREERSDEGWSFIVFATGGFTAGILEADMVWAFAAMCWSPIVGRWVGKRIRTWRKRVA